MRILTSDQIKSLEDKAEQYGLSKEVLMRNAGGSAAIFIKSKVELRGKNCVILCGTGNNGGDGYTLATKLYNDYIEVKVISVGGEIKSDLTRQRKLTAQRAGVKILDAKEDLDSLKNLIIDADVLVDAILGIGFKGELSDEIKALHMLWEQSNAIKFALDIPTGVSADNDEVSKYCLKADYTISFDCLKLGHVMAHSREQSGQVAVVDIGIPSEVRAMVNTNHFLVDENMVFEHIIPRDPLSNKSDYGRLLNIAGSNNMPGAAALSTKGALRVGAGIVTLASTTSVVNNLSSNVFESKFMPLYENEKGNISIFSMPQILDALKTSDCCLVGCGLGLTADTTLLVENIIKQAECPLVIDADGINALAKDISILKKKNSEIILTPHIGEMARLLDMPISEVIGSRYKLTSMFAKEYNVTVILKDYNTIIIDPSGNTYINLYGNPGLAKGGSGDLLAGIIAGLVSQKITLPAVCGVFIHSMAADMCAERKSKYAMLPSDILDDICEIFLRNNR